MKYFAGGNTLSGFVGYYDNLKNINTEKFIIIKGGSGVGKSTIIKKVAKKIEELGDKVEYYHCTGDISSLDGIRSENGKIVVLDGTAPHIVEPKLIGVSDFTVDLSQYLDNKKLLLNKQEINFYINQKSNLYSLAYSYLSSSGVLINKSINLIQSKINNEKLEKLLKYFFEIIEKSKYSQKLFSGGITAEGEYYFENQTNKNILYLSFDKIKAGIILTKFYSILQQLNFPCKVFFSPLSDKFVYELEFDNLIITTNEMLSSTAKKEIINIEDYYSYINNEVIDNLINSAEKLKLDASMCLKQAKTIHLQIEKIYIPNVDFDKVNLATEKLFNFLNL